MSTNSRHGTTLIELICVIAIMAAALQMVIASLSSVRRVCMNHEELLVDEHTRLALAARLRHDASLAPRATIAENGNSLTFLRDQDHQIAYHIQDGSIEWKELQSGKIARQEMYRLKDAGQLEFSLQGGNPSVVRLSVSQSKGMAETPNQENSLASNHFPLILAHLGGDDAAKLGYVEVSP